MNNTQPNSSTSDRKLVDSNGLVHALLEQAGESIIVFNSLFFELGQYGRQRGSVAHSSIANRTSELPYRTSDERPDETR